MTPTPSDPQGGSELRLMRCPLCNHECIYGGIGAIFCGPHKRDDGSYAPAKQMQEVPDAD